ncbi:MAG: 16S rRNA (guanine(966)-N(2))-methyltransferase RsmD [Bacteroidales bacterium]|jgi:16S rRNA (guanine(966)-N(2))-methyltransferase RsmD|nr:16S rRNA (guanine(966)-N(2))-methyltransferase RsmD [Bacteroidales bacterium]
MRIIGGKYKGKIITPPSNFKARPTTDFAKEALFNILQNHFNFENVDVLDLFSGTGSVSYEFASRNCKSVIAVDSNYNHVKYIEKQFETMGFSQAKIYKSDVFRFLNSCNKKFDIIFADPPYDLENIEEIYDLVFKNKLLSDTSLLIIEHSEKNDFSQYPHFMMLKKYGSVHFSFFDIEINNTL